MTTQESKMTDVEKLLERARNGTPASIMSAVVLIERMANAIDTLQSELAAARAGLPVHIEIVQSEEDRALGQLSVDAVWNEAIEAAADKIDKWWGEEGRTVEDAIRALTRPTPTGEKS
jgi:hypothetical protein